ncbi:MAG: tol-pal system protein YbgF [Gammaproteobacteria bacterium]|nr:tol-pal system protein YbgF [Gammaproteobacteria bacterium]
MQLKSLYLTAITLLCSVSLTTFANEAPVVDAEQQQEAVNNTTQPVQSTGGEWQSVSSTDNAASSNNPAPVNAPQQASASENEWQPAAAQQPVANAQNAAPSNAQAPIPVQQEAMAPSSDSGSVKQRVSRLEQQVTNYNQMNLPQEVNNLQQQNAALKGQLEVAQHNLQTVTDQQKSYYQDLQQQIAQLEKNKKTKVSDNSAADNAKNKTSTAFTKKENIPTENKTVLADNTAAATTDDSQLTTGSSADQSTASSDLSTTKKIPSLSDADTYDKAFRSLSDKHFNAAKKGFHNYLSDYPQGQFAVNAHFWLGEIALMNQHYPTAIKEFKTVVNDYPKSTKVPDAKLKIAMIHAAMGKTAVAQKEFKDIRKAYPGTTAAQLSSIRLQQLANATSVSVQQ